MCQGQGGGAGREQPVGQAVINKLTHPWISRLVYPQARAPLVAPSLKQPLSGLLVLSFHVQLCYDIARGPHICSHLTLNLPTSRATSQINFSFHKLSGLWYSFILREMD